MITAIPRVNPSITGHGMYETTRPIFKTPATNTKMPAIRLSSGTTCGPWIATIGSQNDDHGTVGT